MSAAEPDKPTNVRYGVIGVTTLAAVMLYLDRICIAEIAKLDAFQSELGLTAKQTGAVLSAFFFAYALAQVPAGWLSDRFGARRMLPAYIVLWSGCTALTGLAGGFAMLIAARLVFGVAQAGCYPTAGSLVKRWTPLPVRGTASSIVSFGGRLGGAIAPMLTAWLLKDYLGWRWVLVLYGASGLLVALLFWKMFRETPAEHPRSNDAERDLITAGDREAADAGPPVFPPLIPLIKSGTMWLMCALQFGINVGWVFLVTWLPTYLKDVKGVDPKIGGLMSTTVLFAGIIGMLCGGRVTDLATKRLGVRWGRSLPLVICYTIALTAYLACLRLESAWAFIAAASLVAFVTDMSVPAIWAYMQDVGGKNTAAVFGWGTAAVFGWGNMWGNFGAATTPLLVPIVLEQWDVCPAKGKSTATEKWENARSIPPLLSRLPRRRPGCASPLASGPGCEPWSIELPDSYLQASQKVFRVAELGFCKVLRDSSDKFRVQPANHFVHIVVRHDPGDAEGGGEHLANRKIGQNRLTAPQIGVIHVDPRANDAHRAQSTRQTRQGAEALVDFRLKSIQLVEIFVGEDHGNALFVEIGGQHLKLFGADLQFIEHFQQRPGFIQLRAQQSHGFLANHAGNRTRPDRREFAHHRAVSRGIVARQRAGRRARVNRDSRLLGEFHGLRVEHSGARFGHFLRLLVGQLRNAFGIRNHPGIRGINPVHIGANFAPLRAQRRGQSHRRGVTASPAQGGDLALVGHALITSHDDDFSPRQLVLNPNRPHLDDSRVHVPVIGQNPRLAARETDRLATFLANRHAQQRHADAFPSREQHIQFAPFRRSANLLGESQQVVGRFPHRGDDDDHRMALRPSFNDALGDLAQFFRRCDGRTAVFLDDDGHFLAESPES